MRLSYSGDWDKQRDDSHLLDVGDYTARAYQVRPGESAWTWWARQEFVGIEDYEYEEIGRGTADDAESARAAAEAAITAHHAKRFA